MSDSTQGEATSSPLWFDFVVSQIREALRPLERSEKDFLSALLVVLEEVIKEELALTPDGERNDLKLRLLTGFGAFQRRIYEFQPPPMGKA
jgi:hypothetical protein